VISMSIYAALRRSRPISKVQVLQAQLCSVSGVSGYRANPMVHVRKIHQKGRWDKLLYHPSDPRHRFTPWSHCQLVDGKTTDKEHPTSSLAIRTMDDLHRDDDVE
jgi:hypothetical protein